jgi:hypothetical protein
VVLSSQRPHRPWGSPSLLTSGDLERPGREADHLPQSSAEVKNSGASPPLSNLSS